MTHFIVNAISDIGTDLPLSQSEAHHARRVLRIRDGQDVAVLDGQGNMGHGVFHSIGKRDGAVHLTAKSHQPPPAPHVTIYAAVPKGDRANAMIERLVQLGCRRWVPLFTQRSVTDPRQAKQEKWQRYADEALKQCKRAWRMEISEPTPLHDILENITEGDRRIADPTGHPLALPEATQATFFHVLIGPEGGFTDSERTTAVAAGWQPWIYSDAILRIETAAELAVGLLRTQKK